MQELADDHRAFDVANICLLDPVMRRADLCRQPDFREPESGILEVADTPILIPLNELFAKLDLSGFSKPIIAI
jgi:hypothetical protein